MAELVYHNCPSGNIAVCRFDALGQGKAHAYIKQRDLWLGATYMFTIDWYEGNDLLHALLLDNGQFCLLPNHKVKFCEGPCEFPDFKKLRYEWRVPPCDSSP